MNFYVVYSLDTQEDGTVKFYDIFGSFFESRELAQEAIERYRKDNVKQTLTILEII